MKKVDTQKYHVFSNFFSSQEQMNTKEVAEILKIIEKRSFERLATDDEVQYLTENIEQKIKFDLRG